jgi:hypothetical protein
MAKRTHNHHTTIKQSNVTRCELLGVGIRVKLKGRARTVKDALEKAGFDVIAQ